MPGTPTIEVIPGELPGFWERSAIFFANLRSLFFGNEGGTAELVAAIDGIDTYGGRLVPIINLLFRNDRNLLVLEQPPIDALTHYFSDVLGLSLPDVAICASRDYGALGIGTPGAPHGVQKILEHPAEWVDGFVTDSELSRIGQSLGRPTVSTLQGSIRGNNNLLLHEHLESLGLRVFDTGTAGDVDEVAGCLERLRGMGYSRAVVKAQVGASGIGMVKIGTDGAGSADLPDHLFFAGPAVVQGWLDETVEGVRVVGSPSVQVFVGDDRVSLYDLTEQILSSASVHEGNMAPPPYIAETGATRASLFSDAGAAAAWLHAQGYRGTASVDLLVIEREDREEVRVCEINARVTGATYPAVLARRYNGRRAWMMRNIRVHGSIMPEEFVGALRRHGVLFEPGMQGGVLPINLNLDRSKQVAKGQFLGLGETAEECGRALAGLATALPVPVEYDRD